LPPSLKIGDVIFLSCSIIVQGKDYEGVAQGDGLASSILYSIPAKDSSKEGFSSEKDFKKCLF